MEKFIKKIFTTELFKILSINGANISVRLVVGFITSKATALFVGIAGMGALGLVKNFISLLDTFLLLGTRNGIVSKLAGAKSDIEKNNYVVSLFWLFFGFSVFIALVVFIFNSFINRFFFANQISSIWIVVLLVLSIPFQALSLYFNAILNGIRSYKVVSVIGIFTNIFNLFFTVFLMWKFHVEGAIISLFVSSFLFFLFSAYFFSKPFPLKLFFQPYTFVFGEIKPLINHSAMTLISTLISVTLSYFIRLQIIKKYSLEYAGYYEAILRISTFYMIFISTFVSFYFLPEIAKCTSTNQINRLIKTYLTNIFPLFCVGMLILYFTSDSIIPVFYTKNFLVIAPYIKYQIILDIIKAIYFIIGIQFFAFGNIKGFLMTEMVSFIFQFAFFIIALQVFGFKGVWYSQIASSIIYLLTIIYYFKKYPSKLNVSKNE
jgi:O-antigen/teichoic acid export membrane protein